MEFMYLVFTRMPGESYRRQLRSLLLYLCYVFRALINSLVCSFCTSALGLVLFPNCEGHSHKIVSVHKPQLLNRKDSRSGIEPRSFCLPALPLGQTGSHHPKNHARVVLKEMGGSWSGMGIGRKRFQEKRS